MRILISNDDGVDAPGIKLLAQGLQEAGHNVFVVAPDRDRSGASNSLTLDMPIRAKPLNENTWSVAGTPTDCVHLALAGLLKSDPDIVISGINNTSNMGDDVIYSGTVAAAMEGRCLGFPAIAMSLATHDHKARHYESAVKAAVMITERLLADPLPADTILNVNVPDMPWDEIQGFEVTRSCRTLHCPDRSAWSHSLVDRPARAGTGCRAGYRFSCRAKWFYFHHAYSCRFDSLSRT
jgi:5'-nucleotidase